MPEHEATVYRHKKVILLFPSVITHQNRRMCGHNPKQIHYGKNRKCAGITSEAIQASCSSAFSTCLCADISIQLSNHSTSAPKQEPGTGNARSTKSRGQANQGQDSGSSFPALQPARSRIVHQWRFNYHFCLNLKKKILSSGGRTSSWIPKKYIRLRHHFFQDSAL